MSLQLAPAGIGATTIAWLLLRDSGNGFDAYGQEITDPAAQEQRNRQELQIDSTGKLVARISHGFNNLLTLIQGNLSETLTLADQPGTTEGKLVPLLHGTQAAVQNAAEHS